MKKLLTTILLLLFLLFPAMATDLKVTLTDFTISPSTNRTVYVQALTVPTASGSSTVIGNRITYITDVTGTFYISNVLNNVLYDFTVQAPPSRSEFTVWIKDTDSGLISAWSNMVASSTATFPAGTVAWSAASSDLRYQRIGQQLTNFPTFNPNQFSVSASGSVTNIAPGSSQTNNQFYTSGGGNTIKFTDSSGMVMAIFSSLNGLFFPGTSFFNQFGVTNGAGTTTISETGVDGTVLASNLVARAGGTFTGDGSGLTNLSVNAVNSSQQSIMETLINTRPGTTHGINYKQNIPTNFLYLASGEGIVRSIEYTSDASRAAEFDQRTNRSIRIYCDAGTIAFGGPLFSLPPGNLLAEIPLANIMECKYWPIFETNNTGVVVSPSRYVSYVEVPTAYARWGGNGHYTFTLRYPIPFTNGVAIVLWDKSINNYTNVGFSFVNYETTGGNIPNDVRGYRLRTFHSATNSSIAPNVLPPYTGGGEIASLFLSVHENSIDGPGIFEGIWYQQPDSFPSREAWGCAGGEDMFNNGYFFDGGTTLTPDFGTRYIHEVSGDDYYVECYRHFSGADSQRWGTSQKLWFDASGTAIDEWDSLLVYYGK